MLVPPTEGLKVAKYASGAGYAPDQWARALAGVDWEQAELLSDKPGSSVWRAELVVQKRPMTLVIKCEPIDSFKRKVQKVLHTTHAYRHWRGAELLMKHGFRTAEPKAVVYGRRDGVEVECFVMESVQGRSLLEFVADSRVPVREQHVLASRVGAWTAKLWEKGIYNRDHKGSNIIVPDDPNIDLTLVDCIGLRVHDWLRRKTDSGQVVFLEEMLAKIIIEALGCSVHIRASLLMRACHGAYDVVRRGTIPKRSSREPKVRRAWRKFRDSIFDGIGWIIVVDGDPTPEHNPLGGASITSPERE